MSGWRDPSRRIEKVGNVHGYSISRWWIETGFNVLHVSKGSILPVSTLLKPSTWYYLTLGKVLLFPKGMCSWSLFAGVCTDVSELLWVNSWAHQYVTGCTWQSDITESLEVVGWWHVTVLGETIRASLHSETTDGNGKRYQALVKPVNCGSFRLT